MANHKSAIKKARQDVQRRLRNRAGRSRLRTALKKFRQMLIDKPEDAAANLSGMISLIDRSAKHGFIHRNTAGRLKSKLTRQSQVS